MIRLPAGIVPVAFLAAACGASAAPQPSLATAESLPGPPTATVAPGSAAPVELTVFAASSLRGAVEKAATAYQAANPGTTVVVSTDSSAALATKIEQSAPADVFLSADTSNPQKLIDAGLGVGDLVVFAGNELTIIVPTDNPAGIRDVGDLAEDGVEIVAAGDEVPISGYVGQFLDKVATNPGYSPDFRDRYAAGVVSKEENVRTVVTKVELGEGDAAVVYVTDARASTKVAAVPIPDDLNVRATFAGVVVKASGHAGAAQAFLDWFAGPDGQAILAGFGFLPPPA